MNFYKGVGLFLLLFFFLFDSVFSQDTPLGKPYFVQVKTLNASKSVRNCTVTIKYPKLVPVETDKISDWIIRRTNKFLKKNFQDLKKYDNEFQCNRNAKRSDPSFHLEISFEVKLNQGYLLSIYYYAVGYTAGAPHPEQENRGYTFNLKTGNMIGFDELFKRDSNYVSTVNKEIFEGLKELGVLSTEEEFEEIRKNKYDFYLTKDGVNIINLYEIYVMQSLEIKIPIKKLNKVVNYENMQF